MVKPLLSLLVFFILGATANAQRIGGSTPVGTLMTPRYLQQLPAGIIFYEGFENAQRPSLPSGWISQSNGSIGFISGTAGDAPGQANENGFWPIPFHGIFAMSNDDVCNCDKSQDRLISPVLDASNYETLWLFFSAFQNGSGNQRAFVEIKAQVEPWLRIFEIPVGTQWKEHQLSIPASYLKPGFQFRFVYSDEGNYASGLALDDIMLTTEVDESLKVLTFNPGGNGKGITNSQIQKSMPLKQARHIQWKPEARVINEGNQIKNAALSSTLAGPVNSQNTTVNWRLEPNSIDIIGGNQTNNLTPHLSGSYNLNFLVTTDSSDADPTDNFYNIDFSVVDSSYRWFTQTSQFVLGSWLQSTGDRFGSSFSFYKPDSLIAVNIGIHPSSQAGARFRFKIFDFDTLSSSVYSSTIFQIGANDLGTTKRITVNTKVSKGRKLMVIEKESGSERLVLGLIHNQSALDSNVLSKKALESWRESPYFPQIELITAIDTPPCNGYILSETTQPSCFGVSDASITIDVAGTTGINSITWSNGSTNTNAISSLDTGNYAVIITNSNGCSYEESFTISYPDSLKIHPLIEADSCSRKSGSIKLNITGGSEPYNIVWFEDTLGDKLTNLNAGSYAVFVSDINGCSLADTINLIGSDSLNASFNFTLPSCGDSNGSIVAEATGTGPFTYNWGNGIINDTLSNVAAGIYSITITDSLGCVLNATSNLTNQGAPTIVLGSISPETCFGFKDGSIDINVGGGALPYNYNWSNGDITQDLDSVNAGEYVLTLTDNVGCLTFAQFMVERTGKPIVIDLNERGNYCWRDSAGILEVLASGGNGPFTFAWSNGSNVDKIEQLIAGNYTVTVTDAAGCTRSISSTISEGPAFFIQTDSLTEDTLPGILNNGAIYISVFGGTAPFSYRWNDSIQSEDLIAIPNGDYDLLLTDQLGCELTLLTTLGIGPAGKPLLDNNEEEIVAYPNPARPGQPITIQSTKPIELWSLFNMQGQQIGGSNIANSKVISISSEFSGIYQLVLRTRGGSEFSLKILIL